jgi:hypothetical protein
MALVSPTLNLLPTAILALIIERMQLCAALMIERTQRAALESVNGAGLLWLNEAAPSLRSNISQTALVATLDTYDFIIILIILTFLPASEALRVYFLLCCCSCCCCCCCC